MNFEINTNVNSLKDFNQAFQNGMKNVGASLDEASSFNDIFNSPNVGAQKNSKEPHKIKGSIEMTLGADAINSQKVQNISETAQMAQEIGSGFSQGINSLNTAQKTAEGAIETLAAGGDISVHEVMIASQKSSLAMQMAIQLRNQMINAYSEFKNLKV